MASCKVYYLLFSVVAMAYFNQVSSGEPPSIIDTIYKQVQEEAQNAFKFVKEFSPVILKDVDEEKITGPMKTYFLKTNEVIYESAKKLEKEVKPYYSEDLQKQLISVQKQLEDLTKAIKKKEYVENVEKLHETYLEGLKKVNEQIYEVCKTSPVKEYVPEKAQHKLKQFYEDYLNTSKKLHASVTEYLLNLKKKLAV